MQPVYHVYIQILHVFSSNQIKVEGTEQESSQGSQLYLINEGISCGVLVPHPKIINLFSRCL